MGTCLPIVSSSRSVSSTEKRAVAELPLHASFFVSVLQPAFLFAAQGQNYELTLEAMLFVHAH